MNKTPTPSIKTTMDKIAVGSIFRFGHDYRGPHPGFVKISNLYARDLVCGTVRPNCTNDEDAASIPVEFLGVEPPSA